VIGRLQKSVINPFDKLGWRSGTAHILDDDDAEERVRILSRGNRWRRLRVQASAAMGTNLLTVRLDLDSR
jgi:hypothetical protein